MHMPRMPLWLKALATALVLVLLVKTFAFTSCTIPSTGMENSLYPGERVLVNKWSYGLRLPFSVWRWRERPALKGDIVLFNNPNPQSPHTAISRRELFISRVAGVPGDTLMLNEELLVTDEQVLSPDSKSLYVYPHTAEDTLQQALQSLHIHDNQLVGYAEGKYIRSFSHYEYYLLQQRLAGTVDLAAWQHPDRRSHPFVIPAKGQAVKVYPWNITLLCNTIVRHEGKAASIQRDTLYVEGKPVDAYTFRQNYYWMVSNNPVNLCDSRLFGLVPASHLIGKAWLIWFSSRQGRIFQTVQ